MAFQRAEGMSIIQALAMTVAEIPVFLYTTFGQNTFSQLRLSPGLRKVLFATALGTVALALAAHQLKRRKHKKKTDNRRRWKPEGRRGPTGRVTCQTLLFCTERVQSPSSKSNDTLSGISSIEPSKHSSSTHSLASVVAVNSSNTNATSLASWEPREMDEQLAAADESEAEHLYIQGVELFEEALHKWELALNIGQRCSSNTPTAQSSEVINDEPSASILETSQTKEFAGKLESLLSRAYNLQEEFGTSVPPDTMLVDLEGALMFPLLEGRRQLQMDDEISTMSDDSFFSAVELFESIQLNEGPFLPAKPAAAYEDAIRLVSIGEVTCRTVRTQLLGCYNDHDFLAKLHCVRQAFKLLLQDNGNLLFFGEVGKQMVTGLIVRAEKNPKGFIENYEQMLLYASKEESWPTTQRELEGRGVVCMNFFDIVLDFILMDAFEDLENPPSSVIAVLRNRWLSDSFKETALATACWSVLKAKKRLLMVPDGFISHFYSVSEHVSPILAYGFLGPKENLTEICNFFKHQIVQYLKDMFDLDKVRYTTVQSLAEDILHLSPAGGVTSSWDILLPFLSLHIYLNCENKTRMGRRILSCSDLLEPSTGEHGSFTSPYPLLPERKPLPELILGATGPFKGTDLPPPLSDEHWSFTFSILFCSQVYCRTFSPVHQVLPSAVQRHLPAWRPSSPHCITTEKADDGRRQTVPLHPSSAGMVDGGSPTLHRHIYPGSAHTCSICHPLHIGAASREAPPTACSLLAAPPPYSGASRSRRDLGGHLLPPPLRSLFLLEGAAAGGFSALKSALFQTGDSEPE
ncbi:unnamed protein product [Ranitomeya imitator]|uniref:Mitoguardin 2 n=1 Tax=Ranitomeya imitator TaxID=111125 RepID=A0ABN9LS69_9NEOB|nr:unnamed protein product [Ranitomeya imitator]